MPSFYFPLLFLSPGFEGDAIRCEAFQLTRRKWQTSIFDLATLATKHRLHLPYQVMDAFLSSCNVELEIESVASPEEAISAFNTFRLGLYSAGVTPFLSPFLTTHSINVYAGINSRDSKWLRGDLPPGLEHGFTSESGTLEAWPLELSFSCIGAGGSMEVSALAVTHAAAMAAKWRKITVGSAALRAVEEAINAAPKILPVEQSILHIWSAIESLFPTVSTEVTFRVALYLAQLIESGPARLERYEEIRRLYGVRSRIAHGSATQASPEEWRQTWTLLMDACNSVVSRGHLPSEKELIAELLG